MTITSWLRGWRTITKATFTTRVDQIAVIKKRIYERPPIEEIRFWLGYHCKLIRFLQQQHEPDEIPLAILPGLATRISKGENSFIHVLAPPSATSENLTEVAWERVGDLGPPFDYKWRAQHLAKGFTRVVTTIFPLGAPTSVLVTSSLCLLEDALHIIDNRTLVSEMTQLLYEKVAQRFPLSIRDTAIVPEEVFYAVNI